MTVFGISENDDYEITTDNLSKYLEPHLKKLLHLEIRKCL